MRIKLVIADSSEEHRASMKKVFELDTDFEVVGEAENGMVALEKVMKLRPDIIFLDSNLAGVDGIRTAEKISIASPRTAIIMMATQGDYETLRGSMAAGAKEFLVKPIAPDLLAQTARTLYSLELKRRSQTKSSALEDYMVHRPQIVTLFSSKGGVGKTTLSINLAAAAALAGKRVALVDLDLQFGDASLLLSLDPQRKNIYRLIEESQEIDADIVESYLLVHESGVKVLAAPVRPEQAEYLSAKDVSHVLQTLKETHDLIIVDTAPRMDDVFFAAIEASDILGLVATPSLPILKNNRNVLELFKTLRVDMDKVRLLLNRSYSKTGIRKNDVIDTLGLDLFWELPNDFAMVDSSVNEGIPFVLRSPKHRLSQQMNRLLEKIIEGDRQPSFLTRKIRFFGKPLLWKR